MFDVIVIGAGVVGGMIARELSAYACRVCILEKENDVAAGASKANSGIVHAGFDAAEGTLKAGLNVEGAARMEEVARQLGVKYQRNGALVVGFDGSDREKIETLLARGEKNGVKDLRILEREELRRMEPNLSPEAVCALYAPTSAIVCPYELTVAAVGNAMDNGAVLKCGFEVRRIEKTDGGFTVYGENDSVRGRYVVNAAGVYADAIAGMVGDRRFRITPRRGEYILHDKEYGALVRATVFRTPSENGKGILISPTVDENLLTGPTANAAADKEDKQTSADGLSLIRAQTRGMLPSLSFDRAITVFCGLRATADTGDFIIDSPLDGFINAAGIDSPGLSASPAIARYVVGLLKQAGFSAEKKKDFDPIRRPMHFFAGLSRAEQNELIQKDGRFGRAGHRGRDRLRDAAKPKADRSGRRQAPHPRADGQMSGRILPAVPCGDRRKRTRDPLRADHQTRRRFPHHHRQDKGGCVK